MIQVFSIARDLDLFEPRRTARGLALSSGFSAIAAEELCIVVSELATNILKHGVRGEIRMQEIRDPARGPGLRVVAWDVGPSFRNLSVALLDGHDDEGPLAADRFARRPGIGAGLGAVKRFTDSFECVVEAAGKRIEVVRYRDGRRSHG